MKILFTAKLFKLFILPGLLSLALLIAPGLAIPHAGDNVVADMAGAQLSGNFSLTSVELPVISASDFVSYGLPAVEELAPLYAFGNPAGCSSVEPLCLKH